MKKAVKSCLVLAMVFAFGITSVQAADNIRNRDKKKNRSCQSYTAPIKDETFSLAAKKRSRSGNGSGARDGSCQSYTAPIKDEAFSLAAQKRSRNGNGSGARDGSCRG
ncbi:hypothetical protein [Desulforhabdus sp. TSK]|uniref:hypothetical protein n=1 Tax=Desulforhabdus sp. TSK TaxID=2925014 RepID=UPI001FC88851|nr:hypothetical protein [Desulforhabdus sp. TSK]GKT07099.1 hypothetical protein DSTSK_04040 [Desulforhabdus sp. TSK]